MKTKRFHFQKKIRLRSAVLLVLSPFGLFGASSWVPIGPEGGFVKRLVQDVSNSSVFFLLSGDYPTRMYKSTDKGGHWSEVALGFSSSLNTLEVNRKRASEMYMCGYGTFYISTNSGSSWTTVAIPGGQLSDLAPDSMDQNILHGSGYKWSTVTGKPSMVYLKSTNRGTDWTETVLPGTEDGYALTVAVEPKNSRRVWIGGYYYTGSDVVPKVYRTTNGGAGWTEVTGTIAGWVMDVFVDSTNVKRIIVITSANAFQSTDNGASWNPCPGNPAGNKIATDPRNRNTLYLAGYNQVYKSTNGGAGWSAYSTGLSSAKAVYDVLVDRTSSSLVFGGSQTGFFQSTNGGAAWTQSNAGLLLTNVTTLELSPGAAPALYAGVYNEQLYKTINPLLKADQNQAVSWTRLPTFIDCHNLTDVQVLPTDPNVVLAFEGGG